MAFDEEECGCHFLRSGKKTPHLSSPLLGFCCMLTHRSRFSFNSLLLFNRKTRALSSLSPMSSQNLIPPTEEGIAFGASLIKEGELVAFPTETVYGLGANALDAQACTSIFRAKGRPMTDPLIVHVAEPSLAAPLVCIEGATRLMFEQLAAEFWPGPLTIIVKAADCIPPEVTANTGFVGIRCPNHPLALTFLAACERPVAAPSANLFGHVSPTLAQHVLDDLGARGVRVLDGDSQHSLHTCLHGIESTVVKLDHLAADHKKNQITILRQGAVSQAQLERVAASPLIDGSESGSVSASWSVLALQRQVHMEATSTTDTITCSSSSDESCMEPVAIQDIPPPAPTHDGLVQSAGEVAPGQSLTHYAPYIPCYAVASCTSNSSALAGFNTSESDSESSRLITLALDKYHQRPLHLSVEALQSAVILDFLGQLVHYSSHCLAYRDLSTKGDATAAARGLFAALRWAELQPQATLVLIAPIISPSSVFTSSNSSSDAHEDPAPDPAVSLQKTCMDYDLFFGLSDRIFRSTSGASVHLVID